MAFSSKVSKNADVDIALNIKPLKLRIRPWFIILPTLIVTMGILYPFAMAIYYSLTNFSFKRADYSFVGLSNWIDMIISPVFWHSLWVTVKYSFCAVLCEMILGLLVALALNRDKFYTKILRVVLIFPLMVAPVIAVLLWELMTNSSVGILEKLLNIFGVYSFPWAASSATAMFFVVLIDIWVNTPFVILLILAGLQGLPKSPYEAANIDGGSAWFTFKTLTLPLLKPVILITLIFRMMGAIQEFSIIYSSTKGGPGDTLFNLSLSAYTEAFKFSNLGKAIPQILVLWIIINIISKKLVSEWTKSKSSNAN